ncbi:MAG: hypothetical protein U1C58_06250 [Flavobacteriaceae bacterium]|nr:hypothetical protein [Flavobacteriaceae bacterium]
MAKQTSIQAKKALAEQMIVHEGMSAKAVSEALDVSAQSISKWRKATTTEKSWDDKRAEVLAAPHKIRELLMRELKVIAEGGTSVIDADALSKINKVIGDVSDKISPQVVLSVFQEFDNWMADQDPQMAIKFTHFHKLFLQYKINLQGK